MLIVQRGNDLDRPIAPAYSQRRLRHWREHPTFLHTVRAAFVTSQQQRDFLRAGASLNLESPLFKQVYRFFKGQV